MLDLAGIVAISRMSVNMPSSENCSNNSPILRSNFTRPKYLVWRVKIANIVAEKYKELCGAIIIIIIRL